MTNLLRSLLEKDRSTFDEVMEKFIVSPFLARCVHGRHVCVQVATVTPDRLFHMLSKEELEEIIRKLPA